MASDYFLEIEGVKGESEERANAIEVTRFGWNVKNQTKRLAGKPSFQEFECAAEPSSASPQLRNLLGSAQYIPFAQLYIKLDTDPGGASKYLKIKMSDCIITSYSVSGSGGDERPTESISLKFRTQSFFDIFVD